MFVVGATIAVDTFFVIGGLVTVYTFLKATDKGVKFNIVLYYIHRYLRWVNLVLQNNETSKIDGNLDFWKECIGCDILRQNTRVVVPVLATL